MFPDGRMIKLETAHILGTSIRYVHFQAHINPKSILSNYLKKIERIGKRSQPHTIKDRPKRQLEEDSSELDGVNEDGVGIMSSKRRISGEIYLGYDDNDNIQEEDSDSHDGNDDNPSTTTNSG